VKKWLPETSSRAALYGGGHGGVFGKLVGWTEEVRKEAVKYWMDW